MITLSDTAQDHFRKLIEQQDIDGLGIRLRAVHAGTPKGERLAEAVRTVYELDD